MKNLAKKIITVIMAASILLSVLTISVSAAGSSIAFSNNKPTIGTTFSVTGRISAPSGDKIYSLEAYITYDSSIIEFVGGDNCNLLTKGKVIVVLDSSQNTVSQTVKFKAIAAGKSTIAIENISYVGDSNSENTLTGCSAAITVTNPSAQASSDANLKYLAVSSGTLTPKFHPDVTTYSVTIENSVTELWLQATKSNPNASYNVEGSKDMKVGYNKRVVTVTAENGNTKTYTVNVIRLDENGNPPSDETVDTPANDVTEVVVNGITMYLGVDFSAQTLPKHFSVIDYAFNGQTVPALSDNSVVMVFLTMPDGSDSGFYVVNKDETFTKLITIDLLGENYLFYVLPTDKIPDGYREVEGYEIGGIPVPAYKSTADSGSEFFMFYGKGPGGQNAFYTFDTVDQTIQRATGLTFSSEKEELEDEDDDTSANSTNIIDSFNALNTNGKIVAITIPAIMLLLIAVIIVLIVKIATAGKNRDYDYDEEESAEEKNESLGFEFISTNGNAADNETDTFEENFVEEENAEDADSDEEAEVGETEDIAESDEE